MRLQRANVIGADYAKLSGLQGFAALFAGFQIGDFGFFKGQSEFVDLLEIKIQFSGDFFEALGGIGAEFRFQRARW